MSGMFKMARGGQRRQSHGFTEINVTPLVDVMLVLLVVFMISAPMLTVGVPLDLPKTKAAQLNDQIDPVVISVDAAGRSFLQETELTGDALIERLKIVTQSNPEAKIYVRGDANLAYGRIMEVMGEISASGFTKVSLLAEMPTGPKTQPVVGPKARAKAKAAPAAAVVTPVAASSQALPTLQTLMPPQGVVPSKPQGVVQRHAPAATQAAPRNSGNPSKAPAASARPVSTSAPSNTPPKPVVAQSDAKPGRPTHASRSSGTAPDARGPSGRPGQG